MPTYIFIGSLGALLAWGLVRLLVEGQLPPAATTPAATESVSLFLILRAFAGGCTAMTGVEAIANGVPVFKAPESRNAAGTLVTLASILGALFLGVAVLGHAVNAVPSDQASVIAQIGQSVVGTSPLFYVVQLSAAIILALAANTSFNGFPLLAAIMAHDGYLPRQFGWRGLRLAYSNGILVIGRLAIALVVAFDGVTHAIIPLSPSAYSCASRSRRRAWSATGSEYAGTGAAEAGDQCDRRGDDRGRDPDRRQHQVSRGRLDRRRHHSAARHGLRQGSMLTTRRKRASSPSTHGTARHPSRPTTSCLLVPVAKLNLAVVETIGYALSLGGSVEAVHVVVDADAATQLQHQWQEWGVDVPLEFLDSPYREIVRPLLHYIKIRCVQAEGRTRVTVLLPEVVPRRWWQEGLHNQVVISLELALRYTPNVVVTTLGVLLKR